MTEAESECWESAQRWHEKYKEAEAEIERLRAALKRLVFHDQAADQREGLEECLELQEARRALVPKS